MVFSLKNAWNGTSDGEDIIIDGNYQYYDMYIFPTGFERNMVELVGMILFVRFIE